MQTVKALSMWKGSGRTASIVAHEIERRWGSDRVKEYDPRKNCFTFAHWKAIGYKVKKGEKAIRSITFIEKKDEQGNVTATYPRDVCLFFIDQVEKMTA